MAFSFFNFDRYHDCIQHFEIPNLRSRCQNKDRGEAAGVTLGTLPIIPQARETGDSTLAVTRFTGLHFSSTLPSAHALGYMLGTCLAGSIRYRKNLKIILIRSFRFPC